MSGLELIASPSAQVSFLNNPASDASESLEGRLIQAFSEKSVEAEHYVSAINSILSRPGMLSDPEVLFELQQQTANYNLDISMVSTLTRKAVGAVEALMRS
ncbi:MULTISPECIES: type III secretion system inner rod subunit SctI [Pseudomonas]|uniref:type III secretion system inner rod subunit SctI n=1 Tax=Pseudomonas TaxID=286 RepID=UPI000F55BD86|nr:MULTISPECIES: type III secretion system inner rod subunit SctI [Pseudomonas]AZF15597.1 hypothetical protein C4J92_2113 [Pseudomonas sp. R3-18-08]AZF26243.1 hypothetical protein C4J90_2070 [Pseudomonas sp. R2-60-08W]AZF31608.1 hypothetical protein C4J89_2133 [Pseudomonas sp. R4-35-07]AZF36883.1 hypothetical protein C4J88_2100 [Pseudomonas sp. R4-39-08]AZF52550.1 hypothetical protein C4J85_2065 [Pseudomonas sp. R4-34-07]